MPLGLSTASVFQRDECLRKQRKRTGKKVKMQHGLQDFTMMYKVFQFPAYTVMPQQLVSRGDGYTTEVKSILFHTALYYIACSHSSPSQQNSAMQSHKKKFNYKKSPNPIATGYHYSFSYVLCLKKLCIFKKAMDQLNLSKSNLCILQTSTFE